MNRLVIAVASGSQRYTPMFPLEQRRAEISLQLPDAMTDRRRCQVQGRRSLLELVGQYEAAARLERDQVSLAYEIALIQIRLAHERGLLVDGARL